MELKFSNIVLGMFTDEPLEASIPLEKVMDVYQAFANGTAKFVGFMCTEDSDSSIMIRIEDYGVNCSVSGVHAEVENNVLYLLGDLTFTNPNENANIMKTLEQTPWRIVLYSKNEKLRFKSLDREIVLEYAVKQLKSERLI